MVNTEKIKSRMSEIGVNEEFIAYNLKLAQPSLNLKINNKRSMTIDEMFKMKELLDISNDDLRAYFFVE